MIENNKNPIDEIQDEIKNLNSEHRNYYPILNCIIGIIARLVIVFFLFGCFMIPIIGALGMIQIAKNLIENLF